MNWFLSLIERYAIKSKKKDLVNFIDILKSIDGPEIGIALALATHVRNEMVGKEHDMLNPLEYIKSNPLCMIQLSTKILALQKSKQFPMASALMIWLHTLRASEHTELLELGRDMWKELNRGMGHIAEGEFRLRMLGLVVNTNGADQVPLGMSPPGE